MQVKEFFDKDTYTLTYVVYSEQSKDAIIIDPVLNYDAGGSITYEQSIDLVTDFCKEHQLKVHLLMETHAHADHLSGAHRLKEDHFPEARIVIGSAIVEVQKIFKDIFHLNDAFKPDGSQFDQLVGDNDQLKAGSIDIRVMTTPGHTPACVSYVIGDCVFTGDAIFMPDYGTGRCDFPAGSAKDLYHSISQKLYKLADETRVFVGHDYQPGGRPLRWESTIGEQKASNKQLRGETTEEEFVKFRTDRDSTLSAPRLLYQSIQINIAAGQLPDEDALGQTYLKIPLYQKS